MFLLFASEHGEGQFEADRPDRSPEVVHHINRIANAAAQAVETISAFCVELRQTLVASVFEANFVLLEALLADQIVEVRFESVLGALLMVNGDNGNAWSIDGANDGVGDDNGIKIIGSQA